MAVDIIVQPWAIIPLAKFYSEEYPKFSIGIDGAVRANSQSNEAGDKIVIDHHSGDDATATIVRSLKKLLPPHGWTDEMREATRTLIRLADKIQPALRYLPRGMPLVRELLKGTDALKTLSPLLAILGSDPSTRSQAVLDGDHMFRMSTRSACDQALCLVSMGIFKRFQVNGERTAHLYLNHPDEDSCFAPYVFINPGAAKNRIFRGLVRVEDYLDMSAGRFPLRHREREVRQLCWDTQPYTAAKISGALYHMNAAQMLDLILKVHERITATIEDQGKGKELPPDTRCEVISRHDTFDVIREIGAQARMGIKANAFISIIDDTPGALRCTGARMSPFVPFPCLALAEHFNAIEGIAPEDPDRWGGTDTIFGSPRRRGSKQSVKELTGNTDAFLKARNLQGITW